MNRKINPKSSENYIKELEMKQKELKEEFSEIISQPISKESIKKAETRGVDIISESLNNSIIHFKLE